jgi:hypothetical protein
VGVSQMLEGDRLSVSFGSRATGIGDKPSEVGPSQSIGGDGEVCEFLV